MADSHPEVAPLLGGSERPASRHSTESHEHTPLLSRTDDTPRYDATKDDADRHRISSLAATALQSIQDGHAASIKSTKGVRRWPTLIAIGVLALFTIGIITGAFFLPAAIEEYAKQSFVIEPTNLSIHNFTSTGVTVQIQAIFKMDASRVENDAVRRVGRFGTLVVREVETEPSIFEVYLPEYGNILVGTAAVPRIAVDIRDGHHTTLDFPAVLEPGNAADILRIANDWLEGRLDKIRVLGKANVGLKSGIFPLGTQTIAESLVFEGQSLYRSFASLYFGNKSLS
jgi:hypothetical protein